MTIMELVEMDASIYGQGCDKQFREYENMLGNRRQFPSGVRAAACFDL